MKTLLATTMLASFLAVPAFAQDNQTDDVTCEEFIALDATAQADVLATLESMDAEEGAPAADAPAGEAATEAAPDVEATADIEAIVQACTDNPDLTVQEAADQPPAN